MNPLIDVALVLLIFFILTTTYETVRKVLDMPARAGRATSAASRSVVKSEDVKDAMFKVDGPAWRTASR